MSKKFLHDFESYRDSNKKAIKEGMSIYELEDETKSEGDVVDLDSETPEAEEEVAEPVAEEPVVEEQPEVVAEEPQEDTEESLDFGDGGSISQETAVSELEFISGIIAQYQKLAKKEVKLDNSMKSKIRKAFETLK